MTSKSGKAKKAGKKVDRAAPGGATTTLNQFLRAKGIRGAGATTTLERFLAEPGTLTLGQRLKIVDQAKVMLEDLYVHLPLKRSAHATDPVQRLKLLRFHVSRLSERQFHDQMIDIFVDLRDLHTTYFLPRKYTKKTAFLPFLIEEFYEGRARKNPKYLVSKVVEDCTHRHFKPGVIVTSWNGIPIDRAVELNGDRQAGSNPDARHARGLEALTIRAMALSAPPDEHSVLVGYLDGRVARELRVDWQVFELDPVPSADRGSGPGQASLSLGLDLRTELARRAKKVLFNQLAMNDERAAARGPNSKAYVDLDKTSTMPDVFQFRKELGGRIGYIRIRTFHVPDQDAFVAEFVRMADLLPKTGLIVDVRGNGGGNILCAEKLLQVLTPGLVEPALLSFINSRVTLDICTEHPRLFGAWAPSIQQSVETGEIYSQGFPLLPVEEYNRLGQRYQGPVVLITDPLCYSATDIFAAGFQDNKIGPILSAGGLTGAGGANSWNHKLLSRLLPGPKNPFPRLPAEASFTVAARRVIRAGTHRGVPLEDLGVQPNRTHRMTKNDLLHANEDLIATASRMLARLPKVTLEAHVSRAVNRTCHVTLTTKGLDRVDVTVDGRPQPTVDVTNGTTLVEIPYQRGESRDISARGFKCGELKAVVHAVESTERTP